MGVILDPETIRINREALETWFNEMVKENSRPVALVSVDNKAHVFVKYLPGVKHEQATEILDFATRMMRDRKTTNAG